MKKRKMAVGICTWMLTAGLLAGGAIPAFAASSETLETVPAGHRQQVMAETLETASAGHRQQVMAETLETVSEGQESSDNRIYVNNALYSGYYMDAAGVLYLVSDGVPEAKTGTVNAGTSYYDSKTGKTLVISRQTLYVKGQAYSGYYTDTAGVLYLVSNGTAGTKTGTVSGGTSYYDSKSGKVLTLSKSTVFVSGRVYNGYYTDSGEKMYRVTNGAAELKSGILSAGTRYYSYKSGKTLTLSKQTLYVKGTVHTGYYLGKNNKMYQVSKGKLTLKSGIVNARTRYYSGKTGKMRTLSNRTLYVKGKVYSGYYLGKNNKMYRVSKGKLTLKTGTVIVKAGYYSGKTGKMRTFSSRTLYVKGKAYTGYYLGKNNKMYRVSKGKLKLKTGIMNVGSKYYSYKAKKTKTLSKQTLYVKGKAYTGYYLGNDNKMYYVVSGTRTPVNTTLNAGTSYYGYKAGKTLTLPSMMVYVNGKAMDGMSAESLITLQRAQTVVQSITNDSMTSEEKLRVCFEFVRSYREINPRIPHYKGMDWPIVYANDMFVNGAGNCCSYASAFAYMAKAIGYEEVYCCNSGGHGWAEINGLVYDPEWSMHHHIYNYYALSYDTPTDQDYRGAIAGGQPWMRIKI